MTDMKVVSFGDRVQSRARDPDLIAYLQEMLKRAESGDITAVICIIDSDGETDPDYFSFGVNYYNRHRAAGALNDAAFWLIDLYSDDEDES